MNPVTTNRARAARGSLSGRWSSRADRLPNLRGAITVECDLKAGSKLWLAGWTRRDGTGCEFVSLAGEVAQGGARKSRQRPATDEAYEPEGVFRSLNSKARDAV
jgi:hypothetical protein